MTTPAERPTPRTDAAEMDVQDIAIESDPRNHKRGIKRTYVPASVARTLERELASAVAALRIVEEDLREERQQNGQFGAGA